MKIVQYPHPSLRHVAKPLTAIDKKVLVYAEQMLELMYEHRGLALAATQVVLPFRMIVMNVSDDTDKRDPSNAVVAINPMILERKGSIEGDEGCLSFPGLYQKIRRSKTVKVQAYDLKGVLIEKSCSDLEARVWQHEIDHLNGELFIDKMGPIAKLSSRSALKAFERDYRRAQERGEIPPEAEIERLLKALEAEA
ncbi:MAG: peptide deformylase [Gemmataceae bacterium]